MVCIYLHVMIKGTDLAPGKKRKRANSPPPYRPTEDSDTEEKDDAEFQKVCDDMEDFSTN